MPELVQVFSPGLPFDHPASSQPASPWVNAMLKHECNRDPVREGSARWTFWTCCGPEFPHCDVCLVISLVDQQDEHEAVSSAAMTLEKVWQSDEKYRRKMCDSLPEDLASRDEGELRSQHRDCPTVTSDLVAVVDEWTKAAMVLRLEC